ncbi:HNH endonuclease [Nostoc sp.]|uniref:HNH endonuclease n=1 Tax=Nostoc sp. TaxID=1180 RepID=UPI002FF634D3
MNPLKTEDRELSEAEKVKVKERDGYACLCCGVNTKSKLQIDHIKPFSMGGKTSLENSQTLCVMCNRFKGKNEIDFRCNTTKLSIPKKLDLSFRTESQNAISQTLPRFDSPVGYLTFRTESQNAIRTLTRIVNLFYHCKAVYKVNWAVRPYGYNIYLYPENNPEWLLKHKIELLKYIQDKLDPNAYNIEINTQDKS